MKLDVAVGTWFGGVFSRSQIPTRYTAPVYSSALQAFGFPSENVIGVRGLAGPESFGCGAAPVEYFTRMGFGHAIRNEGLANG
jgi:hypothetical protein